jgi:hypothetical protein
MVLITIELCPKPETLPGGDKIVTCTVKNLSDYDTRARALLLLGLGVVFALGRRK